MENSQFKIFHIYYDQLYKAREMIDKEKPDEYAMAGEMMFKMEEVNEIEIYLKIWENIT